MTTTVTLTTSQALLRFLSQQYISIDNNEYKFVHGMFAIFGHGNVTGLGEALEFDNYEIKTLRGNNEQGMAHAAIAFAKQLNRLGIIACTSSIGPGALNMVTAAGVATSNKIPLLLLPGDIFVDRQPDPVLQQIEQRYDYSITANDSFKPVSAYWDRIICPSALMTACINAFRVLTCPAETGAVVLCLPQDIQVQSYNFPVSFFAKRVWHIDRVLPSEKAISTAAQLIKNADCPLIIAGGGVHYSLACEELNYFSELHGIAVAETQAGKSSIGWQHKFSVGGIGTTGTSAANKLAKQADVIIVLGSKLQDFTTASKWQFLSTTKIIHINVNKHDAHKMDGFALLGDIKVTLKALDKELGNHKTSEKYQTLVEQEKSDWNNEVESLYKQNSHSQINQVQALGALNNYLAKEDTIICAAGSLPGDLHRVWRSNHIKDYHVEYGFSCMGYEVAAGLGVSLAKKLQNSNGEAYVVAGDGSFLMLHSELVTAMQESIKYTVLVFNNNGFQCIHNLQKANGSLGFATELRYRNSSGSLNGDYLKIDFVKYSEALGLKSLKVTNINELHNALVQTKNSDRPVVIVMDIAPQSMTHGYNSWWRVDVPLHSKSQNVIASAEKNIINLNLTRKY